MPSSFAQHKKKVSITQNSKSRKSTAITSVTLGNDRYPITRDTLNKFPDSLFIEGDVETIILVGHAVFFVDVEQLKYD
jgi:predicted Rossmann fold nucleotide-binding protein DprA/Smf involved in DNA uptake